MTRSHACPSSAILATALLTIAGCASGGAPADPDPGVDVGDVTDEQAVQVEELLIGRFPGVRVFQEPGGGISVRVWGPGTFNANAEPLFVVDGLPVHVTPGEGLYWLNPGDIQRIEVLKDVSATSAYGARGGNGVVLITTRRGKRDGG